MEVEMESIKRNNVWELVELPKGRSSVGSKWMFKKKVNEEGVDERYKARIVAQGFSQKFGLDYDETFCPVVCFESVRTVIALSVQHSLRIHQMDVTAAFLNGDLQEEVFMSQPEGFVAKGQEHLVCRLNMALNSHHAVGTKCSIILCKKWDFSSHQVMHVSTWLKREKCSL